MQRKEKEGGQVRSERSLVQTCGRAARNAQGPVILYADKITKSMQYTIDETNRRRKIQEEFNRKHGIVPQTIIFEIKNFMTEYLRASGWECDKAAPCIPHPTLLILVNIAMKLMSEFFIFSFNNI
ncbi:MAG: hypothetical protein D3903_05310 [Candidatus Electrothrix sp. GM3_4]|nr:hypothetical protein [Candidatus Electrothrix sp. GM3_4]